MSTDRNLHSVSAQHRPPADILSAIDPLHLLEAVPEMIAIADAEGQLVFVNAALKSVLGRSDGELIGADFGILPISDDEKSDFLIADGVEPARDAKPDVIVRNCHLEQSDGRELPVDASIARADTPLGILHVVVLHDRSDADQKALEMKEFCAAANHELRTPLTSIMGALGLLKTRPVGQEPVSSEKLIKIAYANGQRLTRLINELLEISRIETGKLPLQFSSVELSALVQGEIEKMQGLARSSNVGIRLDGTNADIKIETDANRLSQVIVNLLSNALKYSPAGSEVVVSLKEHGEMARICVRDHGRGIPAEHRQKIFKKFSQVRREDAYVRGGAGLGLYITKEIVDSLGGSISFRSEVGDGTTFVVELPKHRPPDAAVN